MGEDKTEPLARSRTRRSNAGARMHQMMWAAEDDEKLAQACGLLKADDSSDDEDFIPKELELAEAHDNSIDEKDDKSGSDDDASNSSGGSSGSSSGEDSDDNQRDDDLEIGSNLSDEEDDGDFTVDDNGKVVIVPTSKDKKPQTNTDHDNNHSQNKINSTIQPGSPTKAAYESCAKICSVCLGDQVDDDDEVIECDSCGVSVHEACYGVSSNTNESDDASSVHSNLSSGTTEPWFCEPCKRSVKNPYCELCPNTGGIFKQTDTGRWVHVVCALYIRGVTFENVTTLSEVSLFELNYSLYGSKACTLCEDRRLAKSGICIGCDAGLCKTFFHATCAQREGLLSESQSDEVDPYFAHCRQHADKSIIKKKKRICTALLARLKRVNPLQSCPDSIKQALAKITQEPDPHLTKWTQSNQPPIPQKVSRMLMTSPSLIIKLTRKSELLGLDPKSSFMSVQDEIEMARQKWHIPPAFDLEFVAYCLDRKPRMENMKKENAQLLRINQILKTEEAGLREKFNTQKDVAGKLKLELDFMVKEARSLQKLVTTTSGKQLNLPFQMEQLMARISHKKDVKSPSKTCKTTSKTSSTYGCGKCGAIKDQHLLALCDTCQSYFHIYCLDPPLTRVPKKTKFGGWQCSDCSEKDEEEQEEAQEEQNLQAIQEAAEDGPRRLRERIKYPEKYCHESMMIADFYSNAKRRTKKGPSRSKLKKPKIES